MIRLKSRLSGWFGALTKLPRRKKYTLLLIALISLVVIVGVVVSLIGPDKKKPVAVNCSSVITQVDKAMNDLNNKKAYDLLKQSETACSHNQDKAVAVKYNARLAVTTFESGNKTQAKVYANTTLEMSKGLSQKERFKITNFESLADKMHDINRGIYYGMGGIN